MKNKLYPILLAVIATYSQQLISQSVKSFYIGHSLSDYIPEMVKSLADDHVESSMNDWKYQSIPGSPLRWSWQAKDRDDYGANPPHLYGYYQSEGLPQGGYDVLVLTESVPRHNNIWGIVETYEFVDSFYQYALEHNPDIQIYLYEVWHCINSGTPTGCMYDQDSPPWRQRLTADLPMWASVLDTINNRHNPAKPLLMIPGGQGLARLQDSIDAGRVPGINSMNQLFDDDIHLGDVGRYFIACIHFATLFKTSPEGLHNQLMTQWGGSFGAPTPTQAAIFQKIAWELVTDLSHLTGVESGTTSQWHGSASDQWHNSSNWGESVLPTIDSEVSIADGATNYPVISTNAEVKGLTVAINAVLTVLLGTEFTVSGN